MSAAQLAAFLGVSAVVIVTPGQDTALTIRNTLLGGRSGGIATAAGVVSGQLVWALAASAGLSAVLLASAPLFMAIRIAGAAYLVLLGVQALVAAIRGAHRVDADAAPRRRRAPYRQGVLSNLGNLADRIGAQIGEFRGFEIAPDAFDGIELGSVTGQ